MLGWKLPLKNYYFCEIAFASTHSCISNTTHSYESTKYEIIRKFFSIKKNIICCDASEDSYCEWMRRWSRERAMRSYRSTF
jgi:hypothetical protein